MRSNLKKVSYFEFRDHIKEKIELTPYQKEKLNDMLDYSGYYIYKNNNDKKSNILWRITIVFVLPYILFMYIFLPIKYIITGEWGYGHKFLDNFHNPWFKKIGL